MTKFFQTFVLLALTALCLAPDLAHAQAIAWQTGFQDAATPVAERLHEFHHFLLIIITGIVLFVMGLLLFVMVRFNAKANPTPSQTTHNTFLEIVWTLVPVLILLVIAVKSFSLLYYMDRTENPEMTLKVTGYQWYWGYEYPDHGDIAITSNLIKDGDIDKAKGQIRNLSTDNPVILPIDTNIQILVTAQDVLHSFAMPAFGIKTDAVPGRTNETWVRITKPGVYYGQCSELCGTGHAFMPIEIIAVSKDEFADWVVKQGGTMPTEPVAQAATETPEAAPEMVAAPEETHDEVEDESKPKPQILKP